MSQATLLVIEGADHGLRFELAADEVSLGRDAQNAIRLHDSEVSRNHASIRLEQGRYVLTDLRSANGTFLNGAPVQSRELSDGDEIQLGRTALLFSQDRARDESQLVSQRVALLADDEVSHSAIVETSPHDAQALAALTAGPRERALANLQVLYRISEEAVRPTNSLEQLLSRILELTIEATLADRGCILLRDAATGQVTPQVYRRRAGLKDAERMPVSRSIVDYVLRNRHGVRTSDARTDARFAPGESILRAGIREAICVPMQGRYDLHGAMYIDITTPPERAIVQNQAADRFSEELLRLMAAIGRQSALAVEDHRYHQALLKAERLAAVGQTIAILSHHIKNILQGVRGGSYLIDVGLKDHNDELIQKGWHIVDKNQQKIYHLVMDMLTFSKERQPQMQSGSLNQTVADVCELLQARAKELGVDLDWQPTADLPKVVFDEEGIHRAVLNVVGNALDAVEGRADGRVCVGTGCDMQRGLVHVSIADNGPGIAPERLSDIFNIFESTKGARGTGIGLAVSRKIIREHGGDIHVDSRVGTGARFCLEWPLSEVPPGEVPAT